MSWDKTDTEALERLIAFEKSVRSGRTNGDVGPATDRSDTDRDRPDELMACVALLELYKRRRRQAADRQSAAQESAGPGASAPQPANAPSDASRSPSAPLSEEDSIEAADLPPRDLGPFRLIQLLGQGSSGVVFLADDTRLDRQVALKVIRPESAVFTELRERFRREARAASRLQNTHIVPCYEVGEAEGVLYLANGYCQGGSLSTWIETQQEPVSPRTAALIVKQLAEAAHHAHARGIVHRDIKPTNVLLIDNATVSNYQNEAPFVQLADFGLARFVDAANDLTIAGAPLGTAAYMAPEQAQGRLDDVGIHSDVWSLGMILHELLTGHTLYQGETSGQILRQMNEETCEAFAGTGWQGPRPLRLICEKCLQWDWRLRYESAQALADDLERFLVGEPVSASPPGAFEHAMRWVHRHRITSAVLAVVTACLLVVGALGWWAAGRISEAKSRVDDLLYASDLRLADAAVGASNSDEAARLLARHVPEAASTDRRGFVWHHLWSRLHREREIRQAPSQTPQLSVLILDDGRIVTGGSNGRLIVWPAAGTSGLRSLPVHRGGVSALTLSPDQRLVAAADDLGRCALIPVSELSAAEITETPAVWQAHDDTVLGAQFSPDGRWLATGGADHRLRIWDTATRELVFEYEDDQQNIEDVDFWGAERLISTARNRVQVWDISGLPKVSPRIVEVFDRRKYPERREHPNYLTAAVSPDGKRLAFGSQLGPIHLFELGDGPPLNNPKTLEGHSSNVYDLCFNRDGNLLVSASKDGSVRIWDVKTRNQQEVCHGHTSRVLGVALANDDRSFVSVGKDATVRTWGIEPPHYARLELPEAMINGVSDHGSSGWFGTHHDGTTRRVDFGERTTGLLPTAMTGASVRAISSSHRWLAIGGSPGNCQVDGDRRVVTEDVNGDGLEDRIAFSVRGVPVWQRETDNGWQLPRLWDLSMENAVAGEGGLVARPRFVGPTLEQPAGHWYVTTGRENRALGIIDRFVDNGPAAALYRPTDGLVELLDLPQKSLGSVTWPWPEPSPPTTALLLTHAGQAYVILHRAGGEVVYVLRLVDQRLSLQAELVAPSQKQGTIARRDGAAGEFCLVTREGVWSLSVDATDSPWRQLDDLEALPLGTATNANTVVCDATTGEVVSGLHARGAKVAALAFSQDERWLATLTSDERIRIWDWRNRELCQTLYHAEATSGYSVLFLEDDQLLACAAQDDIFVWDVKTGDLIHRLRKHDNTVFQLATSPAEPLLVSLSHDLRVSLWDPRTGEELAVLSGHQQRPMVASFSADGRLLVTGGEHGEIKVWDVTTRQELMVLDVPCDYLGWVGFTDNGKSLTVVGNENRDGRLRGFVSQWFSLVESDGGPN